MWTLILEGVNIQNLDINALSTPLWWLDNRRMYQNIVFNYLFSCSLHTGTHTQSLARARLQSKHKQCELRMRVIREIDEFWQIIAPTSVGITEDFQEAIKWIKHPQLVSDQTSSGSNFWEHIRWLIPWAWDKGTLECETQGGRSGVFMRADV